MTTKHIEYIIMLAQTLNFNRAAEKLFISQPTLTYQIKAAEDEIGFSIFERSGKGAVLTPAGAQFVTALRNIQEILQTAIEQGQNFSSQYKESIRIALPIRSAIYFLPQAIQEFAKLYPQTSISLTFDWQNCRESFLRGEQDLVFAMEYEINHIPDIKIHKLFTSKIYLITHRCDRLVGKNIIREEDLEGRTLMIGGGSPPMLRKLQQQLIQNPHINYFNSHDHDTTLTNVAAERGICLAPGFLNDHNDEFVWIPFDTDIAIPCVICAHKNDHRDSLAAFIQILQKFYRDDPNFPV